MKEKTCYGFMNDNPTVYVCCVCRLFQIWEQQEKPAVISVLETVAENITEATDVL